MVIDENEARLRVRYPLNCEKRRNYKFDIAAVGCDGSYSNTVPVHITVTDVNEFAPVFNQAAYVRSVDEGKVYDEIVRVEATDRDCTPRYGDVCKYEIVNDGDRNQPFAIDNEGVIRNTEPLEYDKSHNHILSVVAYDCGMMPSAPVLVTIKVNKPCRAGWKGLAERVDYAPGTGPLALFPAARLEACSSDERCPGVTRIQAAVTLQASRAGVACDRDTYTLHAQRTVCGLDPKTVDLLPSPGVGNEWAKSLKPDSGRDGEQLFEFDGETSAVVPESILPHSLGSTFSVSTWLRHAPPPDHDKHRKEHVLCLADDHKMNRHHYALFVRNCRLILLLRRDFGEGDLNIFRPAEWRWKLPEVCDNEWHHYAINVRFPNVELYVDGEPYRGERGPEVIDDWPLHPAHGVNTTMVVGACWQGTESDMKHHLRGWLAGLGALPGAVQPATALRCAARCREGLSLAPDLCRDGEQLFEFDGETSAVVPESILPHSLGSTFSVSTWLRHAPPPDHDKHRKEHVLCLADDHKMNRHHYALFVRNCRLILLLRRDFGEGDLNIFRPAEWRWKLPEVCDNEWHHYAINVRFPNVELYVDGEPYRGERGPEVIDDWPLHPAHGVNTTMVVGACWQGTESDMKHHLRGWLAGLGALPGAVQPATALRCAARCREGLSLAPDLCTSTHTQRHALHTHTHLKSVSVEGDSASEVETLVRRVAYGDARVFPTPGRRNVHLATTITCDNGRVIKARPAESYVMVLAPQTPTILLNGSADAARDYAHFRAGLPVFPDIRVRVLARSGDDIKEAETQKLDSCVVSVYPALNPDHEALALKSTPADDIRATLTRDGVSLTGADTVENYQQVLREIEYSNKKPAYYLNRVFKLTCSELNGRFTSNEYVQTLTVEHPRAASDTRALRPAGLADKMDVVREHTSNNIEPAVAMNVPRAFASHSQHSQHAAEIPAARVLDLHERHNSNNVAVVIGAVMAGAVVALVVVVAARLRAARPSPLARPSPRPRPLRANDTEMAWDDSALTITVNPMEEATECVVSPSRVCEDSSSAESCSDEDSDHHDSSDEEGEVMAGKQHKYRNISQLEWDNSTM
ncbi:Calsyntenin-1 [Danaus plexippus plexippus]|uniref:Calsyntenin-1 n=1 Tax=Danaus plexippus plexippus TaxID=278856 RepID=A0A212F612_DANPL|nr:Calsyntenin-1 [Danaus plexippus plexippus]